MSVLVNVHMSKIMRTPIKLGVRTYAKYANCRTLNVFFFLLSHRVETCFSSHKCAISECNFYKGSPPVGNYLFKVNIKTLEQGVKYV